MQRACDACGQEYEAKRATSKFCSASCRVRAHQGASSTATLETPQDGAEGAVTAATRAVLVDADRLQTPLGAAALVLADRLDRSSRETGPGLASVAKQLQVTLEAATQGATVVKSPLEKHRDQLAERRRAKIGA